jgi:hypothetical protein
MKVPSNIKTISALALISALAASLALAGNGNQGNPKVVPPQSTPYGQSYGQWGDQWWQWVWAVPLESNPAFDMTGELTAAGQSGPVWFLAGAMWYVATPEIRTAVRTATIPAGKALFFPVANSVWVNLPDLGDDPWSPEQEVYARGVVAEMVDEVNEMWCEIDGRAVNDLQPYRCQTAPGGAFMVDIPENDVWSLPLEPGSYGPCVQDGIYLMLAPLRAGNHTIRFTASWPDGNGLDITYHLAVQ